MSKIMEKYRLARADLQNIPKGTTKEILLRVIFSFLLSLSICIGPIVILINCFIFIDALIWVLLGLGVCIFALSYLTRFFYLKGLVQNNVGNIMYVHLVEAFYFFIVCLLITVIFLF